MEKKTLIKKRKSVKIHGFIRNPEHRNNILLFEIDGF